MSGKTGGIRHYGKTTPLPYSKILESNGLDDCLDALAHGDDDAVLTCRLAALAFAMRVERYTDAPCVKKLNKINHLFLHGEESAAALNAARDAVWDAAWDAAGVAARVAAWAAAGDAAGAAAGAAAGVAWHAAWHAAGDDAGAAEAKEQMEILRALLAQMEDGPLQHVRNQTEESRMEAETPPEANLVDGEDDDSCAPRP